MHRLWTSNLLKASLTSCSHRQHYSALYWQIPYNRPKLCDSVVALHLKFREVTTSAAILNSDPRSATESYVRRPERNHTIVDGVHQSRLNRRRTDDGSLKNAERTRKPYINKYRDIDNAEKTRKPYINKDRVIEERYKQDYERRKRYTKRPQEIGETEEVSSQESLDAGTEVPEMDEGDVFGKLSGKFDSKSQMDFGSKYDYEPDSDGETDIRPIGRRNKPYWFGTQMKKLCRNGQLKEAIEMLQHRMLKEERVQPIAYNYNILIGACGRAGYTKMAFKLYNDMKKRGILPVDVTYTALINACAESPWPTTDGINRLRKLHGQMQDKDVHINLITHQALMKAYAKCGDVEMTFNLFRHLLASTPHVTPESCSFFFFACASQKEAGLTYAIQGWRYLRQRNIKLDRYCYNLLLRIARDCGIGDIEMANQVLLQRGQSQDLLQLPAIPPVRARKSHKKSKAVTPINPEWERIEIFPINPITEENVEDGDDDEFPEIDGEWNKSRTPDKHTFWWQEENADNYHQSQIASIPMQTIEEHINLSVSSQTSILSSVPNLLSASPKDLQNVVSLGNISTPQDRLALIGGCEGILQSMEKDGVAPDIKTFGLLSGLISPTKTASNKLMVAMDAAGVKGDVDFYNGLISDRAIRRDMDGAKEIVTLLHNQGLFPTIKTFGNLAKGCYKSEDGIQLLEDMNAVGKKPNIIIFSSLISAANKAKDYDYMVKLLNLMLEHQVQPNEQLLEKLENIASFHQNKAKAEKNAGKRWTEKDEKQLNHFRKHYIPWLDKLKMAAKEHPFDKYKPTKYQGPVLNDRDR